MKQQAKSKKPTTRRKHRDGERLPLRSNDPRWDLDKWENPVPSFQTERLAVYELWFDPPGNEFTRCTLLGYTAAVDYPVCMLTLFDLRVEMLNTHPFFLRQGFARELWRGAEKFFGGALAGSPVSPEGEAFYKSIGGAE